MTFKPEQQTLALAGLFQAASLVETLAKTAKAEESALRTSINSIFVISPLTVEDVYGSTHAVNKGIKALKHALQREHKAINADTIRYALTLIHLEKQLKKDNKRLNSLSERITAAQKQLHHFDCLHENVMANLASIYLDTISTLPTRIHVIGKAEYLQSKLYADKIRSLLLAGMRSAVLWRQTGGRRWHLILKRKRMITLVNSFLT